MSELPQPDQATTIRPGQTLIVRYTRMIDPTAAAEVKRRITERLPDIDVLIIGGVDQLMVYDPQALDQQD